MPCIPYIRDDGSRGLMCKRTDDWDRAMRTAASATPAVCDTTVVTHPFTTGRVIMHDRYGKGLILQHDKERFSVWFDNIGQKDFVAQYAGQRITFMDPA